MGFRASARVAAFAIAAGFLLLAVVSVQAQNWLPRCGGQVTQNCYWWLLGPNGLYDHIYQGGPPNCEGQNRFNPACESAGNGGPSEAPAQSCQIPDWVREYAAQGASPPLRYQVGFNQAIARCLQNQCTLQNLDVAMWAAAYPRVGALVGIAQLGAGLVSLIVNPPGFSMNPDPYIRGVQEGGRLCNFLLLLTARVRPYGPIIGQNGRILIPSGFNGRAAMNTIAQWLPKINPSQCERNCSLATLNAVRVLFGQVLEPAYPTNRGWTDQQLAAAVGGRFSNMPLTDIELYQFLDKMPDGTVAIVNAENPNYSGSTPPGPIKNLNDIPGHTFLAIKNGTGPRSLQFWDAQKGGQVGNNPELGSWIYRWMIVGNPLAP